MQNNVMMLPHTINIAINSFITIISIHIINIRNIEHVEEFKQINARKFKTIWILNSMKQASIERIFSLNVFNKILNSILIFHVLIKLVFWNSWTKIMFKKLYMLISHKELNGIFVTKILQKNMKEVIQVLYIFIQIFSEIIEL
jgi:hypothetical protein